MTPFSMTINCRISSVFLSVASVLQGHDGNNEVEHAMVLDTIDEDMLIFKNTYDQDGQSKQIKVSRHDSNAPEELYFVHIEIKDMTNLPNQEERERVLEELKKKRRGF